jgi:glycosyltransferase involved in cell wall biosynthesis
MICNIKFTILIASKNEEKDIRLSIESAIAQTYQNKEILCIDDSDDSTKKIILEYKDSGVTLISGNKNGCCQARNLGINLASGDVIVFLTADTKLEPDYLDKIATYYQDGFDIVMVSSYSFNTHSMYSRFIEMQYKYQENNLNISNLLTTQGYSVRRLPAIAVGGISGGNYPFNTCRDWTLVRKMEKIGCRKIYAKHIVVPHKSPDNFFEYWQVRKTRGLMSAYQPYYLFGKSKLYLFCKFIAKDLLLFLKLIFIIPWIHTTFCVSKYSSNPRLDFLKFLYTGFLQEIGMIWGEWEGFWKIYSYKYNNYDKPIEISDVS